MSKSRGFSLLELSVIITAASAMIIGMLAWVQPASINNAEKAMKTRTALLKAVDGINRFYSIHGRLPCPASPRLRFEESQENEGESVETIDLYPNGVGWEDLDVYHYDLNSNFDKTFGIDCSNSIGVVPVESIGIDPIYMKDGWGNHITYHVSDKLCGTDPGVDAASLEETTQEQMDRSGSVGCTPKDYRENSGDITVLFYEGSDCSGTADEKLTERAAYVLISHGANGKGAVMPSGYVLEPNKENSCEHKNNDLDKLYVNSSARPEMTERSDQTAGFDPNESFDDIIVYRTKAEIQQEVKMGRKNIISVASCNKNSELIDERRPNSNYPSQLNETQYFDLLMATQALCVHYYGASSAKWDGPECPSNATYQSDGSCLCPSGNWDSC